MEIISKRLLYFFILCLFFLSSQTANAGAIKVDKFSSPIKMSNKILQPINLSVFTQGKWRILVEAIDNRIVNQDNPSYSIPISRLELAETGGNTISCLDFGKILELRSGNNIGLSSVNLALNTICFDNDRPGHYVTDIKFTLIDGNNIQTQDIYSYRFNIEEKSSIEFLRNAITLQMDKDKILTRGSSQNLGSPLGVYISSNKNWKLYACKAFGANDNNLKYSMRILGSDPAINCNLKGDFTQISENPILIASGKATFNDSMRTLDKKIINVDYLVKGPDNEYIPAGTYSTNFEYKLETED